MIAITAKGGRSYPATRESRPAGSPPRLTKFEKISAPISTTNSIAVVRALSVSTSSSDRQVSAPRASAMKNAPPAPTPAASVGVNSPP